MLLVLLKLGFAFGSDRVQLFLKLTLLVQRIILNFLCPLFVVFQHLFLMSELRVDVILFGLERGVLCLLLRLEIVVFLQFGSKLLVEFGKLIFFSLKFGLFLGNLLLECLFNFLVFVQHESALDIDKTD
jgi:hypothetical protein